MSRRTHLDAAEIGRELLDSFADDDPPSRAKPAAMAALGVLAVHVSASSAAGAAASIVARAGSMATLGAPSSGTTAALSTAPKVGALLVAKWLGVGALAGAGLLGGTEFLTREASHPLPTTVSATSARRAREATGRGSAEEHAVDPRIAAPAPQAAEPMQLLAASAVRSDLALPDGMPERGPLPATSRAPDARSPVRPAPAGGDVVEARPNGVTSPPSTPPKSDELPSRTEPLAREVRLLDHVRRDLAAGAALAALTLLDAHDREFPAGALQPEAVVLRVEALLQSGDRRTAAELGERSMGALPDGYARRIRVLLSN